MPTSLDPQLRRALAERLRYYNDLGIYDFYRRPVEVQVSDSVARAPSSASQAQTNEPNIISPPAKLETDSVEQGALVEVILF